MSFGKKTLTCMLVLVAIASLVLLYNYGRGFWVPVMQKIVGKRTVAEVMADVGPEARERLKPFFDRAGVQYPPQHVYLLAVKDKSILELWTGTKNNPVFVKEYLVKAASGVAGPKLREGDKQVPEGIYNVVGLNPNSSFHLSMKLDYPNAFDSQHAAAEGRSAPGSDIFIHGKSVSVGCLAMGDSGIEELFVLAADTGIKQISVIISPTDPRDGELKAAGDKVWVKKLYDQITHEFEFYRR